MTVTDLFDISLDVMIDEVRREIGSGMTARILDEEQREARLAPLREYWRLRAIAFQRDSLGLNCLGGDAGSIDEGDRGMTVYRADGTVMETATWPFRPAAVEPAPVVLGTTVPNVSFFREGDHLVLTDATGGRVRLDPETLRALARMMLSVALQIDAEIERREGRGAAT